MLSRYTIYRRRPKEAPPLPNGMRKDTRHATKHILRPTKDMVEIYLANPSDAAWRKFRSAYLTILKERFHDDPESFAEIAELSIKNDVYLGCNCPTKKNPVVGHCHTYVALEFMQMKFPKLKVVVPS